MKSLKEALIKKHAPFSNNDVEIIEDFSKSMLKSGDVCETKYGDAIIYISSEDIKKSHKFSADSSYNYDGMFILVCHRSRGMSLSTPWDWHENLECAFNHEQDVIQVFRKSPKPDMEGIIKDAVASVASGVVNNSNGNIIRRYVQSVLGRNF